MDLCSVWGGGGQGDGTCDWGVDSCGDGPSVGLGMNGEGFERRDGAGDVGL